MSINILFSPQTADCVYLNHSAPVTAVCPEPKSDPQDNVDICFLLALYPAYKPHHRADVCSCQIDGSVHMQAQLWFHRLHFYIFTPRGDVIQCCWPQRSKIVRDLITGYGWILQKKTKKKQVNYLFLNKYCTYICLDTHVLYAWRLLVETVLQLWPLLNIMELHGTRLVVLKVNKAWWLQTEHFPVGTSWAFKTNKKRLMSKTVTHMIFPPF